MFHQLALVWAFHPLLSDILLIGAATGLGAVVASVSAWG